MDAFSDDNVDEITIMASSQVGKTESLYNMLGYLIDQDPSPTLFVMPREADAKNISHDRILPMIESSLGQYVPQNTDDMTKMEYRLSNMLLCFAGSNSPAGLASRPIRYLFFDEVDKYPPFSGKEADPIKLASERQKTFWNKKTVKVSTPTTREGYIFREYEKSDKRKFYVPCPHCGKYQLLLFGQIKWEKKDGRTKYTPGKIKNDNLAWYECAHCGDRIEDYDKPGILSDGKWVPDGCEIDDNGKITGDDTGKHRGFWVNSLYSPWLTWSDIAAEFLDSKNNIELLMNFTNSWLAEVWEEKVKATSENNIRDLVCDNKRGIVPKDAIVLTAGVDVQKGHFYYVIRAWGYDDQSWLIDCGTFEYWEDLEEIILRKEYANEATGEMLQVYMTCIDSGYQASDVYEFCRRWSDCTKAVKGDSPKDGKYYRGSKIDTNTHTGRIMKNSFVLWLLDVNGYKDRINRLVSCSDPVKWHLPNGLPDSYIKQFTAEHKILIRNKKTGKAQERWVKKRESAPNHYLDAEVYAIAAADMIRALNMRKPVAESEAEHHTEESVAGSTTQWLKDKIKSKGGWL